MERIASKISDDWSTKRFVEVSDGAVKKLRQEDKTGLRELEPIEGDIVYTRRFSVGKGISVVTHLTVKGGEKTSGGMINVDVNGKQFNITRINVEVKDVKRIEDSELVRCELPSKVLGGKLNKLAVTLGKKLSEDGKRWAEISFKEIELLYKGSDRKFVLLTEHALEKESINIEHEEEQVKKCLEAYPSLDEWRRMSEFRGRTIDRKQTQS